MRSCFDCMHKFQISKCAAFQFHRETGQVTEKSLLKCFATTVTVGDVCVRVCQNEINFGFVCPWC